MNATEVAEKFLRELGHDNEKDVRVLASLLTNAYVAGTRTAARYFKALLQNLQNEVSKEYGV